MFNDRAFHDTYYVVAHVHWLLSLVLASVFVLVAVAGARRWSGSRLARRTGLAALACWAIGQAMMLAATLEWQTVDVAIVIERTWILHLLNDASSIAAYIIILALVLCLAMILIALWHRIFRSNR